MPTATDATRVSLSWFKVEGGRPKSHLSGSDHILKGLEAMDVKSASVLIEAIAKCLAVEIWPATLIYILLKFGSNIGAFISNIGEMTFSGGGFEASLKRKQNEAGAALAAATISQSNDKSQSKSAATALMEAAQVVGGVNARTARSIEGSNVLWVDDKPQNNTFAMRAMEALGIKFIISESTSDALEKLKSQRFDAIISDMGRPPDPQAGYTLLDALRSSGSNTPFIIFAGSRSPEHQAEAKRRGAIGCTNSVTELFEMVVTTLKTSSFR